MHKFVLRSSLPAVTCMAMAVVLAGCEEKKAAAPPPPPKVTVAKPRIAPVTDYIEFTGNTAATNTVKLVARVEGYLKQNHFKDGAPVKKDTFLSRSRTISTRRSCRKRSRS